MIILFDTNIYNYFTASVLS